MGFKTFPGSNTGPASHRTSTVTHRHQAKTGHHVWTSNNPRLQAGTGLPEDFHSHAPASSRDLPPFVDFKTVHGSKPGPASRGTSTVMHRQQAGTGHPLWTSKQSQSPTGTGLLEDFNSQPVSSRDRTPSVDFEIVPGTKPGPASQRTLTVNRHRAGTGHPLWTSR